ncbi:MAG: DoxX family protein [Solirubrobacterales bacterium]
MSTSQRLLAAFWILGGVNHFRAPKVYEAIMPDWVPMHREMVLWSGVAEIVGGTALFAPATRRFARWWLLGVLAAVYPANVHMALHPERYKQVPSVALWARLPLQFGCAWWVWTATAE